MRSEDGAILKIGVIREPLQLEPARARDVDPEDLWDDPSWLAEEKHDGWRFLMHFGGDLDRVYMTGRRHSSRTGRLSEKGLCAPCLWPDRRGGLDYGVGYTVIDGEVKSPTNDWRDVAGIMNVEPEAAARRIKEIGEPSYVVWDVLFCDGEDVREKILMDRLSDLDRLVRAYGHQRLILGGFRRDDKRAFYDEIVARGGEGVVLKHIGSAYDEPEPSMRWVKVKKTSTVDVIITGFVDAKIGVTGRYLGQIGSLRVSVYGADGKTLVEVARVSGMDDELRAKMSADRESWRGRVVEVEAREFSKERLLSPRFKRVRDDVDPRSCTFGKMLVDLSSTKKLRSEQLSLL